MSRSQPDAGANAPIMRTPEPPMRAIAYARTGPAREVLMLVQRPCPQPGQSAVQAHEAVESGGVTGNVVLGLDLPATHS